MPKRKKIIITKDYIGIIKDKLPWLEHEAWWELDKKKLKKTKSWVLPSIIPIVKDAENEQESEPENSSGLNPKIARKVKKLKLRYTTMEIKNAIEEDEKSLKDVEKLEEHLEEDISKAKRKLKEKK